VAACLCSIQGKACWDELGREAQWTSRRNDRDGSNCSPSWIAVRMFQGRSGKLLLR